MRLHELSQARASLEEAFMELTADSVEYHAGAAPDGARRGPIGPRAGRGPQARRPRASPPAPETEQARAGRMS